MSKVSFRARQIDFNKPLPILRNGSDLFTEFNENALVNRGVPQIPSGMEKEEENEHHFVEVIQALQLRDESDVKIPVPDILDRTAFYHRNYPDDFSVPKQFVHIRSVFLADHDTADYDMDTDDEEWLSKSKLGIDPGRFESMIDRLERGCGQRVMNLDEAKYLLQEDPSLVIAVYDYWLSKRVHSRQPLLFSVRHEKRDNNSNADPYVAFRRRSEKMQTRKNRKNDEQSYEKMLLLRSQMGLLGEILSRLVKRESLKESLIQCERRCFETRYQLNDWDEVHLTEVVNQIGKQRFPDPSVDLRSTKGVPYRRPTRKRKLTQRAHDVSVRTQSSEDMSDAEQNKQSTNEPFAFIRTQGCRYLKPRDIPGDASSLNYSSVPRNPHQCYTLTTVPSVCHPTRHTYTGYIRRRLGRGGRIICDRLEAPDNIATYLSKHDEHLQTNFIHASIPRANHPMHLPTVVFDPKDETLIRRLRPVVLSNHRSRPSLLWPLCTKFSTPSFEPLHFPPWQPCVTSISTTCSSSNHSPPVCTSESPPSSLQPVEVVNPDSLKADVLNLNGLRPLLKQRPMSAIRNELPIVNSHDFQDSNCRPPLKQSNSSVVKSPSESVQQSFLSVTDDNNVASTPHCLWRKFAKRYGSFDALKPSEFSKSRDAEVCITSPTNGFGTRLLQPSDDGLLLTDPSVLTPPKVCCITRDCVPLDSGGPQIQTTNGVGPTQFCQLPT